MLVLLILSPLPPCGADLINSLLVPDPSKRASLEDIYKHPWFIMYVIPYCPPEEFAVLLFVVVCQRGVRRACVTPCDCRPSQEMELYVKCPMMLSSVVLCSDLEEERGEEVDLTSVDIDGSIDESEEYVETLEKAGPATRCA